MKKRFWAVLCALSILLGVLLPARASQGNSTVYLFAANDKICDLPGGLLPVSIGGTIYVPYTAFDKSITGVNLGVYYGIDQSQGTVLTLVALPGSLSFYVNDGICLDGLGNEMDFKAVNRNGAIYVPAAAVCRQFKLTYSVLPTPDRGTLIRLSNSSATLTNDTLISIMTLAMSSRYNKIVGASTSQPSTTPRPSQGPSSPTASPGLDQPHEGDRLYLALDASQADPSILDVFSASQPRVLFLFTPDSLAAQASLVRKAVAAGHSVGLRVTADNAQQALEQLEQGNDLLTHIARTRTHIVWADTALTSALEQQGWRCWRANVSGNTATALLRDMDSRKGEARVTLPAESSVISRVLTQARRDSYDLRVPLETSL